MARTQINRVANIMVFNISQLFGNIVSGNLVINNTALRSLINRMLAYSAIKISANRAPLYSVLNPDTNSDSPSARSNGVRFVSARFVMNHIRKIGSIIINGHIDVDIWIDDISIV